MAEYLLIFPGGGDPENTEYVKSFLLIEEQAKKRGYSYVKTFKYPGHSSFDKEENYINMRTAVKTVLPEILKIERQKREYDFYARSFGCSVVMNILLSTKLSFLRRIVLWGPVPILQFYKVCVYDLEGIELARKKKGCNLNGQTYKSVDPFDIQLLRYSGDQVINIGAGADDKECLPIYIDFLKMYLANKTRIKFSIVRNIGHVVKAYNKEYIDFIFGEK